MTRNITGELRLWSDGKQVHARIDAETDAGPVVFLVSVPLALVRARVLRGLSKRGYPVARGGRKTEALVGFFGRRLALRRLAHAVPRRFASQLSVRRFVGRRLPGLPGRLLLASPLTLSPLTRALSAARSVIPGGAPVPTDGLPDGQEGPVEGLGYGALLGVAPVAAAAAVSATPKIMAGAKLLSAAATNPKALAQVKRITHLAKVGNPAGKAAFGVLKKANIFRRRRRAAAAAAAAVPAAAALAVRSSSARSVAPTPQVPSAPGQRPVAQKGRRRFFSNWQRGVE